MKKYKQFRAEQQHLAEIGPIGAVMMGAMGLFGLGFAGYKMYKKTKEGITGYVESRTQKKDNKKNGMDISLKVYNPESGKEEHQDFFIDPSKKPMNPELEAMGVKIKRSDLNTDDEGISKLEKKHQLRQNKWNKETRREFKATGEISPEKQDILKIVHPVAKPEPEPTGTPDTTDKPDTTADDEKEVDRDEEGNIKNQKDAQAAFEKGDFKQAPDGWIKDPEDEKKVIKPEDIKKKQGTQVKTDAPTGALKTLAKGQGISSQNILSFGEFIAEDVMSDMKKASKSSKDSEIKLGDGTVIPIDKLTAQIFVKYIEGLEKSEQKKTINQIQRTERAFMKVLGQAHEG
ncbi:MAG: hypothetical protein MK200_00750 [Nitrosopumilus sp.]|nr:hypothetical protein [Nitrosopumilus sp.]